MTYRLLPLLLLVPQLACTAALKEENNRLEDTIGRLESEVVRLEEENARLQLELEDERTSNRLATKAKALGFRPGEALWARITTSMGEILCRLEPERAPATVANFIGLAEGSKPYTDPRTGEEVEGRPYYDGTIVHRAVPEFMIQMGDPTGTGRGGPGYTIDDEFHPELRHEAGTLSMANTGTPNSGGAQFFITEVATPHLDDKHSVFGSCEPLDLVKRIARVPKRAQRGPMASRPAEDVRLVSLTIHRGGKPR